MRYRKNINCLSTNELHDLREAFTGIYALPSSHPKSFEQIAGLHGSPSPSYCIHSDTGFFTWHRAYLLELEAALRYIKCDVTLPYWNWSSGPTTGLPPACSSPTYTDRNGADVPNPLFSGPKPASLGGGQTNRRNDIDTTSFSDLATTAQTAMAATNFSGFVSQVNNVHGSVHGRVGGDMSGVSNAGFDPIFYLHHANVDRMWANWQNAHPNDFPSSEAAVDLDPFTKPFTNVWYKGGDLERTTDFDYQYYNFCFFLPPFIFPRDLFFEFDIDDWLYKSRQIALNFTLASMTKYSVEIKVFINDPKANLKSKTEGNPNYAGSIGIFGMGTDRLQKTRKTSPTNLSLDITDCLRTCVGKNKKKATVKLVPDFAVQNKKLDTLKNLRFTLDVN